MAGHVDPRPACLMPRRAQQARLRLVTPTTTRVKWVTIPYTSPTPLVRRTANGQTWFSYVNVQDLNVLQIRHMGQ